MKLKEADENQRDLWFDQAGVPGLFGLKGFADFDRAVQPKAYDAVKNYAGKSLVLLSPGIFGVGKTHLVSALCTHLLESKPAATFYTDSTDIIQRRHCPVLFVSEGKLLSRIRQTFNRNGEGETEEDIYRSLLAFPLLVIDDVGKTQPRDNCFLQGVYFRVIDDRYQDELPVVVTTNLSLAELEAHIGGAVADRLREMASKAGFIVMTGKSYRKGAK